jgi:hypothetical protein
VDSVYFPYDSLILRAFNREHPESFLLDDLPKNGTDMFQPAFFDVIVAEPSHPLNLDIKDNDLYDWAPTAPVQLFYCTEDEQIPYQNALFTADTMRALGADVEAVFAVPFDHGDCTFFALMGAKFWFDTYKENCMVGITENEAEKESLKVFPNPFFEQTTIESLQQRPVGLTLYNLLGEAIYSHRLQGALTLRLPGEALPSGSYILVADLDGKRSFYRLIKQR